MRPGFLGRKFKHAVLGQTEEVATAQAPTNNVPAPQEKILGLPAPLVKGALGVTLLALIAKKLKLVKF